MKSSLDVGQLGRFLLAGVAATAANMLVVWSSRWFVSYQVALLIGIVAGSSVSFLMTKFFAFRSRAWDKAPGEAGRFLLVYGLGLGLYWIVSMSAGAEILPRFMSPRWAEMLGLLIGAGAMTITSYLGHKFYTYRRSAEIG